MANLSHPSTGRAHTEGHGPASSHSHLLVHTILPVAVGVVVATVIGGDGGIPAALTVCAAVYLAAAAAGRPAAAWWAFAAAIPLIGLGEVFDNQWVSLLALGVAQVLVFLGGLVRERWKVRQNRLQVLGAAGFALLAAAAAAGADVGAATVAAVIVIAGLIVHAVWDVVHHWTATVVAPSYSAFCAGLDAALAVAVTITVVTPT